MQFEASPWGKARLRRNRKISQAIVETLEPRCLLSALTFASPVSYAVGGDVYAIAASNLTGNGIQDLVTANNNGTVSVLLGNGDGTFQPAETFSDGLADNVSGDSANGQDLAVVDLGNGHPDILVTNETTGVVEVLMGNGTGTFSAPQQVTGSSGVDFFAVANLGNGTQDLVTANINDSLSVFLGNGNGTFQPPEYIPLGGYVTTIDLADINGDGNPDIVLGNEGYGTAMVLYGNGQGGFGAPQTITDAGTGVVGVNVGNFNGHPDLLVTHNDGTIDLLLGNGAGTFQTPVQVYGNIGSGGAVDFNGDGKLDLVAQTGTQVSILLGNGDGTFQSPTNAFTVTSDNDVDLEVNLTGDGIADFVGGYNDLATIDVRHNATTFAPRVTTNPPASISAATGQTVTFTAAAVGNPIPTVQWEYSTDGGSTFSAINGATSTSYSLTVGIVENGDELEAVFTNSQGTATTTVTTLSVTAPPVITTNPTGVSVPTGLTATFTAAATRNPAPTVQWQGSTDGGQDFKNIPSATSSTYSFTAVSSQSGDQFRAIFTSSLGTATTKTALLKVSGPAVAPEVTTNPVSQDIKIGKMVKFTAAATGNATPTVQWQMSSDGGTFSNISGATSTTFSFTAAAGESGNEYKAIFTNSQGTATTVPATLTLLPADLSPPVISTNPSNDSVPAGQTASFTVVATGNPTPRVLWQVSTDHGQTFHTVPGADSTTLTFVTAKGQNANEYDALVFNSQGQATSSKVLLTVTKALAKPVVTIDPASLSAPTGQTVTFTAAATGVPNPTVQWQVSTDGGTFTNIASATSSSFSLVTAPDLSGNEYQAVFTNSQGTATTTDATLTVTPPLAAPAITVNPTSAAVTSGQTVTFSASATGTPTPTVVWQLSKNDGKTFTTIAGATTTTYDFTAAKSENGYEYRAVFTNSQGKATTTTATLDVS
jgi:hypothetical protein